MQKVLITRPRMQADPFADEIREAGMQPVYFPVIEIYPIENNSGLREALHRLDRYDWLIFTSVNGVNTTWTEMTTMGIEQIPDDVRVAAIGPKTAAALKSHGVEPGFVPDEYVAEAIMPGLGDLAGRAVLLLRAETARKALTEAIIQAGGIVHEVAVYRTLPKKPDTQGLLALRTGVDVVTLTSPSTVQHFVSMVRAAGLNPCALPGNPVFACIGPITEQAARAENLPNRIMADTYTTEGLVKAIQDLEKRSA